MAVQVGQVVQRFAVGAVASERTIPNTRATRERLNQAVYGQVVRPYFIGSGDEPISNQRERGGIPRANSAYMRLIFSGVEGAVSIEAERQARLVEKYADGRLQQWLMGARPIGEQEGPRERSPWYDPFHKFVYEKSTGEAYTLSDAVWDTASETRNAIDKLLAYHIANGAAAVDIAELLVPFLTTGASRMQTATPYPPPYGTMGSYAARRLARTEITAASGRAYVNAALLNPWIAGTKWNLSPSHPEPDICDNYASQNGGVYETSGLPPYPAHPHCLCYLTPVVVASPREVNGKLRADLDYLEREVGLNSSEARRIRNDVYNEYSQILRMQGAFNKSWMTNALTFGDWILRFAR